MYAIVQVLARIRPKQGIITTVVTDSLYCVRGWMAGRACQMATFNDDLWHLFFQQVERLDGQLQLIKVKSHLTLAHAARGAILLHDLTGNTLADLLAKQAAARAAVPEKIAASVAIGKAQAAKILRHLVQANLTMVRLLEEEGHRKPQMKAPPPKQRYNHPRSRGHLPRATGKHRWQCSRCLAIRSSLAAHRWPARCTGAVAVRESGRIDVGQSQPSGEQVCEQVDVVHCAVPQLPPAADLDDDQRDPFDDLDDSLRVQDAEMLELEVHHDEAAPTVAPPAVPQALRAPQPQVAPGSWWDRIGEVLPLDELRLGGAVIHHSHILCSFGNSSWRIAFCTQCAASTQGGRSLLLAEGCTKSGGATKMRMAQRMLDGNWPEGRLECHGRGTLCPPIRFLPRPDDQGVLILRA